MQKLQEKMLANVNADIYCPLLIPDVGRNPNWVCYLLMKEISREPLAAIESQPKYWIIKEKPF